MTDERMKIAVFIDYDNIEIGVKTTLGGHFDVGAILEAIKERGEVVTKVAYGDWKRSEGDSRALSQHAIRMVQRNLTPGGDKNGADINLALDALEMALTHDHINAYVIVGGDSDFITLVEKLKQYDKKVLIVGGRQFTSVILQKNCHEFIAYENLVNLAPSRTAPGRLPPDRTRRPTRAALDQAFPLVQRALAILSEREVSPQLGLLKSTLLQLDSTFSERDYGASTFRDFAEKLAEAGVVNLKHAGRSILVELKEGASASVPTQPAEEKIADRIPADVEEAASPSDSAETSAVPLAQPPAGTPADAVRIVRQGFQTTATPPRWPMYVRNVKQLLRLGDPTFDERRYGFGGILDLLRACQREGVLRLERDRQGVLRVFPGAALQKPVAQPAADEMAIVGEPVVESVDVETETMDAVVSEVMPLTEPEPIGEMVDTAAETITDTSAEPERAEAKPRRRAPARGVRKSAATPRKRAASSTTKRTRGKAVGSKTEE